MLFAKQAVNFYSQFDDNFSLTKMTFTLSSEVARKGTENNPELGQISVGKFSSQFNKFKQLCVMRRGIVQPAHTVLVPVRIIH